MTPSQAMVEQRLKLLSHIPAASNDPLQSPMLEGVPVFAVHGLDQQTLPLVVVSPHSGRYYPESMKELTALDDKALMQSEDTLVDRLVEPIAWRGGVVLEANIARAYVDLNREPNELNSALFDGFEADTDVWHSPRVAANLGVIPGIITQKTPIYSEPLPFGEAEARLQSVYHPFHMALCELVQKTMMRFGQCLLVDCHSMPPLQSLSFKTEPTGESGIQNTGSLDVVIGDRSGSSCDVSLSLNFVEQFRQKGLVVERNRPFAGGAITQRYAMSNGLGREIQSMQIELSRQLYLNFDPNNMSSRYQNQQFYMIRQIFCNAIIATVRRFAHQETFDVEHYPLAAE